MGSFTLIQINRNHQLLRTEGVQSKVVNVIVYNFGTDLKVNIICIMCHHYVQIMHDATLLKSWYADRSIEILKTQIKCSYSS